MSIPPTFATYYIANAYENIAQHSGLRQAMRVTTFFLNLQNNNISTTIKLMARRLLLILSALLVAVMWPQLSHVFAQSQSTNFTLKETSLGGLGNNGSQSTNFQATTGGGTLGIGNNTATNTQINAGNETTDDPGLSFAITSPTISFGSFSAATATTSTSTFEVSNYTSYGYVVMMVGTPPTNGAHTISAMGSTDTSQAGTEQYGINLVANTSPTSFGANPNHGQFGFGDANTGYDTPNNFRFVSGEQIATGPKSSGKTIYTVSYLINVSSLTPGGVYTANQTFIVTATF